MNVKSETKVLWEYLSNEFELEEIENAFDATIKGFEYHPAKINAEMINSLSDENVKSLLFDINYMAVNELFGGDFETWNEILTYTLGFDEETIDFLNY